MSTSVSDDGVPAPATPPATATENDTPRRRQCSMEGCTNLPESNRQKLCQTHSKRGGGPCCKVEGCTNGINQGGLCIRHGAKRKSRKYRVEGHNTRELSRRNGVCKVHEKEENENRGRFEIKHQNSPSLKDMTTIELQNDEQLDEASEENATISHEQKHSRSPNEVSKSNKGGTKATTTSNKDASTTNPVKRSLCSAEGCTNLSQQKGLCLRHARPPKPCRAEGCTNKGFFGGLCIRHGGKQARKICNREGCRNVSKNRGMCKKHSRSRNACCRTGCSNDQYVGCEEGLCQRHFNGERRITAKKVKLCRVVKKDCDTTQDGGNGVDCISADGADARAGEDVIDLRSDTQPDEALEENAFDHADGATKKGSSSSCEIEGTSNEVPKEGTASNQDTCTNLVKKWQCSAEGCTNLSQRKDMCQRHYRPPKPCKFEGCKNKGFFGGLCIRHGGKQARKICSVEGCRNIGKFNGMCRTHNGSCRCSVEGCRNVSKISGLCAKHKKSRNICCHTGCLNDKYPGRGGFCQKHFKQGMMGKVEHCRVKDCTNLDRGHGVCRVHEMAGYSCKMTVVMPMGRNSDKLEAVGGGSMPTLEEHGAAATGNIEYEKNCIDDNDALGDPIDWPLAGEEVIEFALTNDKDRPVEAEGHNSKTTTACEQDCHYLDPARTVQTTTDGGNDGDVGDKHCVASHDNDEDGHKAEVAAESQSDISMNEEVQLNHDAMNEPSPPTTSNNSKRNKLGDGSRDKEICTVEGCNNKGQETGVCVKHDATHYRKPPCSVEGCNNQTRKGGLCRNHSTNKTPNLCKHPEGCTKYAQSKTGGLCHMHGKKMRLCGVDGCTKTFKWNGVCKEHALAGYHKNNQGEIRERGRVDSLSDSAAPIDNIPHHDGLQQDRHSDVALKGGRSTPSCSEQEGHSNEVNGILITVAGGDHCALCTVASNQHKDSDTEDVLKSRIGHPAKDEVQHNEVATDKSPPRRGGRKKCTTEGCASHARNGDAKAYRNLGTHPSGCAKQVEKRTEVRKLRKHPDGCTKQDSVGGICHGHHSVMKRKRRSAKGYTEPEIQLTGLCTQHVRGITAAQKNEQEGSSDEMAKKGRVGCQDAVMLTASKEDTKDILSDHSTPADTTTSGSGQQPQQEQQNALPPHPNEDDNSNTSDAESTTDNCMNIGLDDIQESKIDCIPIAGADAGAGEDMIELQNDTRPDEAPEGNAEISQEHKHSSSSNDGSKGGVKASNKDAYADLGKRRQCSKEGCTNLPQQKGLCMRHARPFKPCRAIGCTNKGFFGGLCIRHGGKQARKICKYEGCTARSIKGGLCKSHNYLCRCSVEGCKNISISFGLCTKHKKSRNVCCHPGCAWYAGCGGFCERHFNQGKGISATGADARAGEDTIELQSDTQLDEAPKEKMSDHADDAAKSYSSSSCENEENSNRIGKYHVSLGSEVAKETSKENSTKTCEQDCNPDAPQNGDDYDRCAASQGNDKDGGKVDVVVERQGGVPTDDKSSSSLRDANRTKEICNVERCIGRAQIHTAAHDTAGSAVECNDSQPTDENGRDDSLHTTANVKTNTKSSQNDDITIDVRTSQGGTIAPNNNLCLPPSNLPFHPMAMATIPVGIAPIMNQQLMMMAAATAARSQKLAAACIAMQNEQRIQAAYKQRLKQELLRMEQEVAADVANENFNINSLDGNSTFHDSLNNFDGQAGAMKTTDSCPKLGESEEEGTLTEQRRNNNNSFESLRKKRRIFTPDDGKDYFHSADGTDTPVGKRAESTRGHIDEQGSDSTQSLEGNKMCVEEESIAKYVDLSFTANEDAIAADINNGMLQDLDQQHASILERVPPSTLPILGSRYLMNDNDVLFKRGRSSNLTEGNKRYYALAKNFQQTFVHTKDKKKKQRIVRRVVSIVRSGGGRFLHKNKSDGCLYEVGDDVVEMKVGRLFREGLSCSASDITGMTSVSIECAETAAEAHRMPALHGSVKTADVACAKKVAKTSDEGLKTAMTSKGGSGFPSNLSHSAEKNYRSSPKTSRKRKLEQAGNAVTTEDGGYTLQLLKQRATLLEASCQRVASSLEVAMKSNEPCSVRKLTQQVTLLDTKLKQVRERIGYYITRQSREPFVEMSGQSSDEDSGDCHEVQCMGDRLFTYNYPEHDDMAGGPMHEI